MNIVDAIRKMCEPESGFADLFDKGKSYEALLALTDDRDGAELFAKLIYGRARDALIALIGDVYEYQSCAEQVLSELVLDGLSHSEAEEALGIFLRAFGFPGYRAATGEVVELVSYETESFRTVFRGEVKDGKEYGVGVRSNFFEGAPCGFDECVWIKGRMLGYCYSLDVEFGAYETKKYGFVLNDTYVGKYMNVYEDGATGYMTGEALPF